MRFKNDNSPFVALLGITLLILTGGVFIHYGYTAYSTGHFIAGPPGSRLVASNSQINEATGEYAKLAGIIFIILGSVICSLSYLIYKSYKQK